MAVFWSLFLIVLQVYAFKLYFSHIGQHTFKYILFQTSHILIHVPGPQLLLFALMETGCCKSQCSTCGMQDTLWISAQCAYNWPRIRVLAAVDRSGPSESNSNFRYVRCGRILPKYFYSLKTLRFLFPIPYFFHLINPRGTLKIKYIFKTKYFLLITGETAVYYRVQIYPQKYIWTYRSFGILREWKSLM